MLNKIISPKTPWSNLTRIEQVKYLAENFNYKIFIVHGVVDGACTCGSPHAENSRLIGKHPAISKWEEFATDDANALEEMFRGREHFNYGIYMRGSGLVAIDIDVKEGGWNSWNDLEDSCDYEFSPTVEVETGLGKYRGVSERGAHKYYQGVADFKFANNLSKAGFPSIDMRDNAYVLGPGSKHVSGYTYEWKPGHAPWEIAVSALPPYSLGYLGRKEKTGKSYSPKSSIGDDEWQKSWESKITTEVEPTPYAKAALKNTCAELEKMKPGSGRNNALNAKAFVMGRLIGGGQLGFPDAYKALKAAIEKSYGVELPHKASAIETTLRAWGGGFETGALEPKYPNEISEASMKWIRENYASTSENLEAFVETAHEGFFKGKDLRRIVLQNAVLGFGPIEVGPGKTLWSYSNGFWKSDGEDLVTYRTGHLLGDEARPAHTATLIHFMKTEAQTIFGLGPERYINLKNGMLDWRTGLLTPHSPTYYSTVQLPHFWNPNASCPTVDEFLLQVAHEDLIDLIWEIIGICIYTGIGFQQAIFLDGGGRNGKGTLVRLIEQLIPGEFVSHIELQSFSTDKFAKAQVFNKILNVVGDLSSKALNDTSLFKQLTGQDTISADYKYGATFDYKSEATLLFAANELPYSSDTTHGFFERLLIVPFDKVTLKKDEVDHSLEPRMALELEGVLVKAIEGLRRAKERGHLLQVPRCQVALDRYRTGTNVLSRWVAGSIEFTDSPKDRIKHTDLFNSYLDWCQRESLVAVSSKEFYDAFGKFSSDLSSLKKVDGYQLFTNVRVID